MPIYNTGKSKNGKEQYRVFVNFTDINGKLKRKTKCVYGLREAQKVERTLSGEVRTSENKTLQQLYDEYFEIKVHDVRRTTLEHSKAILNTHVMNTDLADRRIDKLNKVTLQEWKSELAKTDLKLSTKNHIITNFNALLNYAVKMEYIPKNPLKEIGKFKDAYFETAEDKIQYYTAEEFNRFITVAKQKRKTIVHHGCYIFFVLAFYTGMRKGEINALKWSDIEGNVIHVRRSISQKVKGYEETPPKNKASWRALKIPKHVVKVLDDHRHLLAENFQFSEDLRVCGGIKPLPNASIDYFNKICAAGAELRRIRIHDFRHSHASLLCNANINIMEISRRLGHSDVKMTWNTYSHLYPKTEEEALNILEQAK